MQQVAITAGNSAAALVGVAASLTSIDKFRTGYLLSSCPIDLTQEGNDEGLFASSRWAIEEQMWAVPIGHLAAEV